MTLRSGSKSTTIFLLRHAHSEANLRGTLSGRKAGVNLSDVGKKQAAELIERLGTLKIQEIHYSPLERCFQTIEPFLRANPKIPAVSEPAFVEMDYGKWSGLKLSLLSKKKLWSTIQQSPSRVRFPEGESFTEMSARVLEGLEKLRGDGKVHLVVSHGDVIRVALNHYLGSQLDNFQRLSVDPASISALSFHGDSVRINFINSTVSVSTHNNSTLGGGSGKP